MANYDFECTCCNTVIEISCKIDDRDNKRSCLDCGCTLERLACAPLVCKTIIPIYPGCGKFKAGSVHLLGDKPATKTLSGPYGCVNKP